MNEATREYIREHADSDVRQLALQGKKNPEVDMTYALEQIAGRQKAKTKLPSWAGIDGIVYPPHISMEQCSSEQTARYKGCLVTADRCWTHYKGAAESGTSVTFVDLTGGFGVDFAFMASAIRHRPTTVTPRFVYLEQQPHLCAISSENFKLLGLDAEVVNSDGIEYLHQMSHVGLVFIDPARRDSHGGRTYGIAECTPNVLLLMDELMQKTDVLLLKLSPMLDWRKAVKDIQQSARAFVAEVHIVSVENECKELLLLITGKEVEDMTVCCVNLISGKPSQYFSFQSHNTSSSLLLSPFGSKLPADSLIPSSSSFSHFFEPNASIMKAGCYDELQAKFPIAQLDKNSHLYVSNKEIPEFPGRQFEIIRKTSMNRRELKEALEGIDRANIAVRNFPLTVADLRKRLKLKDGGDVFIFATTVAKEGHQLFICRKIG